MTEAEWLTSDYAHLLWQLVFDGADKRKPQLLAVALCRYIWPLLTDERSRAAVEVAERFADGEASEDERVAARDAARCVDRADAEAPTSLAASAAICAVDGPYQVDASCEAAFKALLNQASARNDVMVFADIVRDIFGNPFRPVTLDPSWLTSTVTALAAQMYESRDFSAMPILADALQDEGCNSAAVLDHCRGPGPHARGCWVVDLVLGKE